MRGGAKGTHNYFGSWDWDGMLERMDGFLGSRRSRAAGQLPIYPLAIGGASAMSLQARELYSSANGDRWSLVRDSDTGRVFIRHEPNQPSGGRTSAIEIGEFLARGGSGPEYQELVRLIGTLVEPRPSV